MNIRHWIFLGIIGILAYGCNTSDAPAAPDTDQPEDKENEQEETPTNLETYHYKLPVIFHVLYKDKSDKTQYVTADRLKEILEKVNKLYADATNSVDMNMEFTLATTDESGNTLTTPGVEYVKWPEQYPIDFNDIMNDGEGVYIKYLWEPTKYINVMLYNFQPEDGSEYTTLGVSHMPFTPEGTYFLEGTNSVKYGNTIYTKENLGVTYCVSINSSFIYEESSGTNYTPSDIVATLAHELGHYVGLHHVFSEAEDETSCEDTDYCEDTPSYNKNDYDNFWEYVYQHANEEAYNSGLKRYNALLMRKPCSGEEFESTNIMDYSVSKANEFTLNQRSRVRHVLMYAALMPGPKYKVTSRAGSVSNEKIYPTIPAVK